MGDAQTHREQAHRAAEWAQSLLAQPATLDSYDWLLVATLLVEADAELKAGQQDDPPVEMPLLAEVLEELREATSNFRKPEFLRATKPARRQNPTLFTPRS